MNPEQKVPPLTVLAAADRQLRDDVRKFSEESIRPRVAEMDRKGQLDPELLPPLFSHGFMGIDIPAPYGGRGADCFQSALVIEELARVDPGVAVLVDVQNMLVNYAVIRYANAAQKQRFLPMLASRTVGAFALSERESGSDAFAMTTAAHADGDSWVLNGNKRWTTSAGEAGLFAIVANTTPGKPRGATVFLVERDHPGLEVGRREDKMGIRASSTCELHLRDVRLPRDAILGEVGAGFDIVLDLLTKGRIGIAAQMVGLAQGALEASVQYARRRKQFGEPIANFQAVQCTIADMSTDVEAARLLTYNAARLFETRSPSLRMAVAASAGRAKQFAAAAAERVASGAIDVFGGVGYTRDAPVEKFYRDAKIGQIYEGTSNMLRRTIAAFTLGEIA